MADVTMTVAGVDELAAALKAMGARVEAATGVAVKQVAALATLHARVELSRFEHEPGTPTPSPPDSPPAKITGKLRGSFHTLGPTRAGQATWVAVIGPTTVYARIQELGGAAGINHASVLPPRPYMRPAAEDLRRDPLAAVLVGRLIAAAITG